MYGHTGATTRPIGHVGIEDHFTQRLRAEVHPMGEIFGRTIRTGESIDHAAKDAGITKGGLGHS
jgi:hypothetical protein